MKTFVFDERHKIFDEPLKLMSFSVTNRSPRPAAAQKKLDFGRFLLPRIVGVSNKRPTFAGERSFSLKSLGRDGNWAAEQRFSDF